MPPTAEYIFRPSIIGEYFEAALLLAVKVASTETLTTLLKSDPTIYPYLSTRATNV